MKIFREKARFDCLPATAAALGAAFGAALGNGHIHIFSLTALLLLLFFTRRTALCFIISGAIAFTSASVQNIISADNDRHFPASASSYYGEAVITDRRTTTLDQLPQPYFIRAELFNDDGKKSAVYLKLPDDIRAFYGDRYRISGSLYNSEPPAYHYSAEGVGKEIGYPFQNNRIFRADKAELTGTDNNFIRRTLRRRDLLLQRLISGMKDQEVMAMAARLFFGASNGASTELKRSFIISGTIHLFAVSGMHVAVLSFLLLSIFKALPFRIRYLLTAALLAVYVLMTGMNIPALRAGMMLISWCVMRALLYYIPSWNIMMILWSMLLFITPATVADLGVQYSFGITAALIMAFERLNQLRKTPPFYHQLMPEHNKLSRKTAIRYHRFYRKLSLPLAAVTAFIAGSGISLIRQNIFNPGALAANILLPMLLPLMFGVMFFKILFGKLISSVDILGAKLLEYAFNLLADAAGFLAETFGLTGAVQPCLIEVMIFYILVFLTLNSKKLRHALIFGLPMIMLLLSWPLRSHFRQDEILIFSDDHSAPATLIYLPAGRNSADICDLPYGSRAAIVGSQLRKRGFTDAELSFSRGVAAHSAGVYSLNRWLEINSLHLPRGKKSKKFMENLAKLPEKYYSSGHSKAVHEKNIMRWHPETDITIETANSDEGRKIKVFFRQRLLDQIILPWSSSLWVWRCKITPDQ